MRGWYIVLSLLLAISLWVGFAGCAKPAPAPSPKPAPSPTPAPAPAPKPAPSPTGIPASWPRAIEFDSIPSGSTLTILITAIGDVITRKVGVPVTVRALSGSSEVQLRISEGKAQGGASIGFDAYNAYRGSGPYEGKAKGNVRNAFFIYMSQIHIVTLASSDIKSVPDMRGKRIMCVRPATPTNEIATRAIFKFYGMDREKDIVAIPNLTPEDQAAAFREGTAVAAFQWSAGGVPAYMELHKSKPIRFIALSKEALKSITETHSWMVPDAISRTPYPGITEDVPCLAQPAGLQVRSDLPDDLVYAIVKAVYENMDYLRTVHGGFKETSINNATTMYSVFPTHPGAIRYYKEKGVWTAEMDKINQKQLAEVGETK